MNYYFATTKVCDDLKTQIENHPTRFSITSLFELVQNLHTALESNFLEVDLKSKPELEIELLSESESHKDGKAKIRMQVSNKAGRSPAYGVEIRIESDPKYYEPGETEYRIGGSLRGGDRTVISCALTLSDVAVGEGTFSIQGKLTCVNRKNNPVER